MQKRPETIASLRAFALRQKVIGKTFGEIVELLVDRGIPPQLAEQIAGSTSRPSVASPFTKLTMLVGLVEVVTWVFTLPTRKTMANGVTLSVLGSLGGALGIMFIVGAQAKNEDPGILLLGGALTALGLLGLTLGTLMIRGVQRRPSET